MARILVVEDDKDFQEIYAVAFTMRGHVVEAVRTAEQALDVLGKNDFDLLLVDLLLPGMDGAELCRTIRSDPSSRHLPILMLSNMGDRLGITFSEADVSWAPVDRFLDKSVAANEMSRVAELLLEDSQPDQPQNRH
jgi:CheY-like chemotaxis protein